MKIESLKDWMEFAQRCGEGGFWNTGFDPHSDVPPFVPARQEWTPPVDIVLGTSEIIVYAELPGVRREELNISVTADSAIIKGFKKSKSANTNAALLERYNGGFERTLRLPQNVDTSSVSAKLEEGVLQIRLPIMGTMESHITVE